MKTTPLNFHPCRDRWQVNFKGLLMALGLTALLSQAAWGQLTLPVYEPFNYGENEQLGAAGSSGTNWTYGNSVSSSSSRIVAAGALSFTNLVTDPTTKGLRANAAGKNRGLVFTAQTSGSVYASFLLNLLTNGTGNRCFFALSSSTTGTGPTVNAGLWLDSSGRLMLSKNSNSTPDPATTSPLARSNIYLIVLRYTFNPGTGDDEVALWVNPAPFGNNANIPTPTLTTTNGSDAATVTSMAYMAATGTPVPLFYLDEIRVATTWAEVTPTICTPGNVYAVSGGGQGCGVSSLPINLSGSDLGVDYWFLADGVPTGTVVAGTGSALTASFGSSGFYTVMAHNVVSDCYYLMAGGASISIVPTPNILAQPASVSVASGASCIFSVTVDVGTFTYQWRRYGTNLVDGGNISGSQTPTLTISPVGAADAASGANSYYVVVSGACPPAANSTMASLSLRTAANLVWQGDGGNNYWDLATTPDWTNSAGAPTVFNLGDSVTFDDTSVNAAVTPVGSYLSIGSLHVNASGTIYTIGGGGTIAGLGGLTKDGTASLIMSSANSFSGGSILNNGVVVMNNYSALGTGEINLAGSTLELNASGGSATVGLYNDLRVSSDSTLQYDKTGSYGFVLFGELLGPAGKTLVVNHSGTGPDRIRVYHTNIVCNVNLALTSSGIQLAPYSSSGSQIFNGVISGAASIVQRGSGGTTVLAGANTYSGGTLLTTGTIGLGTDSVSTFPPTIDSSPLGLAPLYLVPESATSGSGTILAFGGARTVANPIQYPSNTLTLIIGGTNNLTLSGAYTLSGQDGTGNLSRTIQVNNTAVTTISGVIDDAGLTCGLIKTGTNSLILSAATTYTGPTAVSNGTLVVNGQLASGAVTVAGGALGGTGTINGPVTVLAGGAISPGASIGTLTINNSLTLGGNLAIEINKSGLQSSDKVVVSGLLSNTGTGVVSVANLGPGLAVGDSFSLFNKALANGAAMTVTGAGVTWTNKLAVDGSIQVLSTVAQNRTNISYSVSGTTLTLTWPVDHLGWSLQSNSISVASTGAWYAVPGSQNATQMVITIDPAKPTVFYRMSLP